MTPTVVSGTLPETREARVLVEHAPEKRDGARRIAQHRKRLTDEGLRRVEVTVPAGDAGLVRHLARQLREDSPHADALRRALSEDGKGRATTGKELLAFFRSSPLIEETLEFERDRSTGRPIKLP